jgi:hypothetical protein
MFLNEKVANAKGGQRSRVCAAHVLRWDQFYLCQDNLAPARLFLELEFVVYGQIQKTRQ